MDLALWALNHQLVPELLADAIGCTPEQAGLVYKDIQSKQATTHALHSRPLVIDPVPEVKRL